MNGQRWTNVVFLVLALGGTVVCSRPVIAQEGPPPGGFQPTQEMIARMQAWRKWRAAHPHVGGLERTLFGLAGLDRDSATRISRAQARKTLQTIHPWQGKSVMTDAQAGKVDQQLASLLTAAQRKRLESLATRRRGGPPPPGDDSARGAAARGPGDDGRGPGFGPPPGGPPPDGMNGDGPAGGPGGAIGGDDGGGPPDMGDGPGGPPPDDMGGPPPDGGGPGFGPPPDGGGGPAPARLQSDSGGFRGGRPPAPPELPAPKDYNPLNPDSYPSAWMRTMAHRRFDALVKRLKERAGQ